MFGIKELDDRLYNAERTIRTLESQVSDLICKLQRLDCKNGKHLWGVVHITLELGIHVACPACWEKLSK